MKIGIDPQDFRSSTSYITGVGKGPGEVVRGYTIEIREQSTKDLVLAWLKKAFEAALEIWQYDEKVLVGMKSESLATVR